MINRLKQAFAATGIAAIAILHGCAPQSSEESQQSQPGVEIFRSELTISGPEKYVATLHIEGMGCEIMCGTKISGALSSLEGVSSTEIDFKGEGELSSAVVEYDASILSEEQMIQAVGALANGHYKVIKVDVVHYISDANSKGSSDDADEKSISLVPDLGYRLPNIFGIFRFLF